jgi:hypothetical protein
VRSFSSVPAAVSVKHNYPFIFFRTFVYYVFTNCLFGIIFYFVEEAGIAVTMQTCTVEVYGSNLGWSIDYHDRCFEVFLGLSRQITG